VAGREREAVSSHQHNNASKPDEQTQQSRGGEARAVRRQPLEQGHPERDSRRDQRGKR
jgi:hypothetical protein